MGEIDIQLAAEDGESGRVCSVLFEDAFMKDMREEFEVIFHVGEGEEGG